MDRLDRARLLLADHPVVDGHNDLPWALREQVGYDLEARDISTDQTGVLHTDIPRLRAGGVGAQFWSVYVSTGLTGDDAPDLLELGRARGGSPLEAPLIDELPDDVGPCVVVTRFDLDLEGRIWVTVTAAARRDGLDATATWRSTELGLVALQTPAVVELVGRVRLVARADRLQETTR